MVVPASRILSPKSIYENIAFGARINGFTGEWI